MGTGDRVNSKRQPPGYGPPWQPDGPALRLVPQPGQEPLGVAHGLQALIPRLCRPVPDLVKLHAAPSIREAEGFLGFD
jgi:hypothetical protein